MENRFQTPTGTSVFHPSLSQQSPWLMRWISLAGPDARDFLHRLTTARAHALNPGDGTPAAFLNAHGRTRAVFTLWCLEEEHFGLEVPAGAAQEFHRELLAAIDQYTFAEKMTLTDVPTDKLATVWIFDPTSIGGDDRHSTQATQDEIRINHHGVRDFGLHWTSAWGRPERLRQWLERTYPQAHLISSEQVLAMRVAACRPWVGTEITDAVTPLDIGIPDAVAENKGCYPGQEVVEKIAALGSPARRLIQAAIPAGATAPTRGVRLWSLSDENPMELGEVTSVSESQFLAIVRKTHAKTGAEMRIGKEGPIAQVSRVAPYLNSETGQTS